MKTVVAYILLLMSMASCHYPHVETNEGVSPIVRKNANLELYADSIALEQLPVKDTYIYLYRGARVVVAEFEAHPADSVDSVWVKVAHSQEIQGWLRQSDLITGFVPVDILSQSIYLFSHSHVPYFIVFVALFIAMYLFRVSRKKQIRLVYFNDIDSIYPLMLCLLVAISASLYESIQIFAPATWQQYFFNPTLSPLKVPAILSFFLISFWLIILVMLAAFDDVFRQLSASDAFFYLLGLMTACIFCYFIFILTTRFYIGYLFLGWTVLLFARRFKITIMFKYHCGNCGRRLKGKGICPYCGIDNV